MKTFYKILGVSSGATTTEIRTAFKKLALKHHPDKGGNPEKFKEISMAHEVLSDLNQRTAYDQHLKHNPQQSFNYTDYYRDPELSIFEDFVTKQPNPSKIELFRPSFYIDFYSARYTPYKNDLEKLKKILSPYKGSDLTVNTNAFIELQRLFHFAFNDNEKRAEFIKYYIDEIVPNSQKQKTIEALQDYIIGIETAQARKAILDKLFTDQDQKERYYVSKIFINYTGYMNKLNSFGYRFEIGKLYAEGYLQYIEEIKNFRPEIILNILQQESNSPGMTSDKGNALYHFLDNGYSCPGAIDEQNKKTLSLLENLEPKYLNELLNHKNSLGISILANAQEKCPELHQDLISTLHKVISKTTEKIIHKTKENRYPEAALQPSEEGKSLKEIRKNLLKVKNSIGSELLAHRLKQIKSLFTGEKTTLSNEGVKELKYIKNNIGITIRKNYTIVDRFIDNKRPSGSSRVR